MSRKENPKNDECRKREWKTILRIHKIRKIEFNRDSKAGSWYFEKKLKWNSGKINQEL